MRQKQEKPKQKAKSKRGQYNRDNLVRAYHKVKEDGWSVCRAAMSFCVPETTLRDRVDGRIPLNVKRPGPTTLFTEEEEQSLVEHIETMAQIGYGMTHSQLRNMAGDLSVALGRRAKVHDMSNNWVYRFLARWSDRIGSLKPRSLESCRAKSATQENLDSYYEELERIIVKYGLHDKPHRIFNVDETGLKPEHKPPNILASINSKPNTTTSPKGNTVTLYGCVSAIGQVLPPYFIFKGIRCNEELLKGALPGTSYCMSESGWGNSATFLKFLEDHFLKYTQAGQTASEHTMLLYDGHGSHVSKQVIDWALKNKVVIFVLPPHTSHLTQPLDVGCFGPFKRFYNSEVDLWMKTHMGQTMTRYEICEVACKAYPKAMTYKNITTAFEKVGIYPICKTSIPVEKTFPAEPFREKRPLDKVKAIKGGGKEVEKFLMKKVEEMQLEAKKDIIAKDKAESIVKPKKCPVQTTKKPSPGGKAITEVDFRTQLEDYEKSHSKGPKIMSRTTQPKKRDCSPKPSTSGLDVKKMKTTTSIPIDSDSEEEDSVEFDQSDNCCVCGLFEPKELKDVVAFEIVKWASCTKCGHWVHLKFCTPVRCVRTHAEFLCMHCIQN